MPSRVDGLAGQHQIRRAPTADPPGDAHRAAGAGDQAEAQLRQAEARRPGRDTHPPAERRHLQSAAQHLTVHLGAARRPSRAVSSSSTSAGLCRVRARWALAGSANVPNSARSPPLQNDAPLPTSTTSSTDGSRRATVERFEQCGAGVGRERVVPLRPVEPDVAGCCRRARPAPDRGSRRRAPVRARRASGRTPGRPAGSSRPATR